MALAIPGPSHRGIVSLRLNGKNYAVWKFSIKKTLTHRQLQAVVYTTDGNLSPEQIQYKEAEAADLITSSLEPHIVSKVLTCNSAREIWDRLRLIYEQDGDTNLETCIIKWATMKQGESETISNFIARYDETVDRITTLGEVLSERLKRSILLGGLNKKYESFRRVWNQTNDKGYQKLLEMLFQEEAQMTHNESQSKNLALLSRNNQDNELTRGPRKLLSKEDFAAMMKTSTCLRCGQKGHWKKNCRVKLPSNTQSSRPSENVESKSKVAFMARTSEIDNKSWFADSGASAHYTGKRELFTTYKILHHRLAVTIGDGRQLDATGIGTINFKSELQDGSTIVIQLTDVLYVPEMTSNLVSVVQSMKNGVKIIFDELHRCRFKKNGKEVAFGCLDPDSGLIKLKLVPLTPKNSMFLIKNKRTAEEWHRSLVHLNARRIQELASKGIVEGIDITNSSNEKCTNCPSGKGIRSSHPSSNQLKSVNIGETVHLDLVGPVTPISLGGSKYFLLLTDEATNYRFAYCITNKTEVADKLADFIASVESETSHKVKELKSDQGTEFVNEKVRCLLALEHVRLSTSTPYTPEQNGLAERSNRTVIQLARTILDASGLDKCLWSEAVSTVVFVLNRTAKSPDPNKTPYELWTKRKPGVSHIHEFGKRVQILETGRRLPKWSSRTLNAYLVGFDQRTNTYRVFVPESNEVKLSCDVMFVGHKSLINDEDPSYIIMNDSDNPRRYLPLDLDAELERESDKSLEENRDLQREENDVGQSEPAQAENRATGRSRFETLAEHHCRSVDTNKQYPSDSSTSAQPDTVLEMNNGNLQDSECDIESPSVNSTLTNVNDMSNNNDNLNSEPGPSDSVLQSAPNTSFFEANKSLKDHDHLINQTKDGISGFFRLYSAMAEPSNYKTAVECEESTHWQQAIKEEVKSLQDNRTWELSDLPHGKTALTARWIFRKKIFPSGEVEKYKARLVARGYEQRDGVDYFDTYAPVAQYDTIRCFIAIIAHLKLHFVQFDVQTAFLYGDLHEEIYLKPPDGIDCPPSKVLRLRKSLYGLKQSPLCWKEKLDDILKDLGLLPTISDPCLYRGHFMGKQIILVVYVDDGMIASTEETVLHQFVQAMNKQVKVRVVDSHYFIGFQIESRSTNNGDIVVHQKNYIGNLVKLFNQEESKTVTTPIVDCKLLNQEDEGDFIVHAPYRELIGSLNYAACLTRPDIAHAISVLSKFNNAPKKKHWEAAKHCLKYLKSTVNYCLRYKFDKELKVICYSDADWAGDVASRKSTSGMIAFASGAPIVYRSKLQSIVALSSTESEYIAASSAAKELVWLNNLFSELELEKSTAILRIDNQSTIRLVKNQNCQSRKQTRHIDIRTHHIRDCLKRKEFDIEYVPSIDQLADVMTKSLPARTHKNFMAKIGLLTITLCAILSLNSASNPSPSFGVDDLVVWRPTKISHIHGQIDMELDLMFKNPCTAFFGNITSIPKLDKTLVTVCNRSFNNSISENMKNICKSNRLKERDAGVSTAIAAVSAIVVTVHKMVKDHEAKIKYQELVVLKQLTLELEEKVQHMREAITILNDRVSNKIGELERDIDLLSATVKAQPEIIEALFLVLNKLDNAQADLKQLKKLIKTGENVPTILLTLFELDELAERSSLKHSTILQCEYVEENYIKLRVALLKPSMEVDVLKADPFHYLSVSEGQVCKFIYVGPEYMLYNKSSNCARPVDKGIIQDDIIFSDGCTNRKIVHESKKFKEELCYSLNKSDITVSYPQVKHFGQTIYINCQGHHIIVDGIKRLCPNNVFSLNHAQTFSIDGFVEYSHEASRIKAPALDYSVPSKINLMLGVSNTEFKGLTADEVEVLQMEAISAQRKELAESLTRKPSVILAVFKQLASAIDLVGEYVAVTVLIFLLYLFVKGRMAKRAALGRTPAVIALVLMLPTILAVDHLIEIKLNREDSTREIIRHQNFMKEKWCNAWRLTDSWMNLYNWRGDYPQTLSCALALQNYTCPCISTSEWVPIVSIDRLDSVPTYKTPLCPLSVGQLDRSATEQIDKFKTATEYLCYQAKHEPWSRENLGQLVVAGCLLARKMHNCACAPQSEHLPVIMDELSKKATNNMIKAMYENSPGCDSNLPKTKRTSIYDEFYGYSSSKDRPISA